MPTSDRATACPSIIAKLPLIAVRAKPLDQSLWALLTRLGPLTADEWAIVEAAERDGQ